MVESNREIFIIKKKLGEINHLDNMLSTNNAKSIKPATMFDRFKSHHQMQQKKQRQSYIQKITKKIDKDKRRFYLKCFLMCVVVVYTVRVYNEPTPIRILTTQEKKDILMHNILDSVDDNIGIYDFTKHPLSNSISELGFKPDCIEITKPSRRGEWFFGFNAINGSITECNRNQ